MAVITGAAQGIGLRIAEVLAGLGYRLALFDLRPADSLPDALWTAGDVSSDPDVAAFAAGFGDTMRRVAQREKWRDHGQRISLQVGSVGYLHRDAIEYLHEAFSRRLANDR